MVRTSDLKIYLVCVILFVGSISWGQTRALDSTAPIHRVTIGSTQEDVIATNGTPTSISKDWNGGDVWTYPGGSITLESGRVTRWDNWGGDLRVTLGEVQPNALEVTLGSTPRQVVDAIGTPSSFSWDWNGGQTWNYPGGSISFQDNQVARWNNWSGKLRVKLGDFNPDALPVTVGSSYSEVLSANGTPTSFTMGLDGAETWNFSDGSITFLDGSVAHWNDWSGKLRVTLGDQQPFAPPVTIGSTPQEVIASNGTPRSFSWGLDGSATWTFQEGSITFVSERVGRWDNWTGKLRVTLGEAQPDAPPITLGSTRRQVVEAQGTPRRFSWDFDGGENWLYPGGSLTFVDGRIARWDNWSGKLNLALGGAEPNLSLQPTHSDPQRTVPIISQSNPLPNYRTADSTPTGITESPSSTPKYFPSVAENGSYYGQISAMTGRPKTVHVRGYFRKDGTYVRSHYRSRPRR